MFQSLCTSFSDRIFLTFQITMSDPHPAILKVRAHHGGTVARLRANYFSDQPLPKVAQADWVPKNPNVDWPPMTKETSMLESEWKNINFPHNPLPAGIVGQVNIAEWDAKISELKESRDPNHGLIRLMEEVGHHLKHGADSLVTGVGTSLTKSKNQFKDPIKQLPRVADALASFTSGGHMAGPLFGPSRANYKINPIMAINKPGGHIRVVGNFKYPQGRSFNEGIPEEKLKDWPVTMLTAAQFSQMIVRAGRGSFMACSDMKDAYKMIPVCHRQRRLQAYEFCGAMFIELKLVFGDRMACQFFDKFHHLILQAFVYPTSSFPQIAQGKTVDDIPSVVPAVAKHSLERFVQCYRNSLRLLNIRAADDDPSHTKAFDCSTEGEVLGIRFNTETFTWSLPKAKLSRLVENLRKLCKGDAIHSLRELEAVFGMLNHVSQLCPPIKTFTAETVFLMGEHIRDLAEADGSIANTRRDVKQFRISQKDREDLLLAATLLSDTWDHPLPIIETNPPIPLCAVPVYTDASGNIKGPRSPALGIYFYSHSLLHSAAHSIPFPTDFLLHSTEGKLVANTTSTLEALGILLPMMLEPHRCVGQPLHIHIDNIAIVFAFHKRRSNDKLAHSIIRASYLVAGALACQLFVSWVPRRSDVQSIIADDLTHTDFESAARLDPNGSTVTHDQFPPPIQKWMQCPVYDKNLGHAVLAWMAVHYDNLL